MSDKITETEFAVGVEIIRRSLQRVDFRRLHRAARIYSRMYSDLSESDMLAKTDRPDISLLQDVVTLERLVELVYTCFPGVQARKLDLGSTEVLTTASWPVAGEDSFLTENQEED